MRGPSLKNSQLPLWPLLPLLACMGCSGDDPITRVGPEWITELEYRFTGTAEQGVLFNRVHTSVDPNRNRILVLDPQESQVSAWKPDGSLVFVVGRKGEGPGEFAQPSRIYLAEDGGFTVREGWGTRFTHYTADGELLGTEIGVTTAMTYQHASGSRTASVEGLDNRGIPRALLNTARVGLEAPTGDGGYLARPLFGASRRAGILGGQPMEWLPILRVRRSEDGQWLPPEPIFRINIRNAVHAVPVKQLDTHSFSGQHFGDADLSAFAHGKVLVMQRAGGPPGALDLLELNVDGDTLWKRRLQFEPLKLTPEWAEEVMDIVKAPDFPLFGVSRAEQLEYLKAFEETLYKPEYLPPAQSFFLSAADEVWIRTFERSDTLRVYYTIPRDDMSTAPRRVLLPESFSPHDATATHVWGTRDDLLGVPYVVGRKLRRAGAS